MNNDLKISFGKLIASAVMDVIGFEAELKESLDIEKAVINNIKVNEMTEKSMNENQIKEYIFNEVNWGQILKLYHVKKQDEIIIYLRKVNVKNMKIYERKSYDSEGNFIFDVKELQKESIIVTHSFIPNIEHHIENFMGNCLNYAGPAWNEAVILKDED